MGFTYKIVGGTGIKRSDNAQIPKDIANSDYRQYLKWVEAGNTIEPEFTDEEIEQKRVSDNIEKALGAIALTDKTQLLDYRTAEDRARWADYRVIILLTF